MAAGGFVAGRRQQSRERRGEEGRGRGGEQGRAARAGADRNKLPALVRDHTLASAGNSQGEEQQRNEVREKICKVSFIIAKKFLNF